MLNQTNKEFLKYSLHSSSLEEISKRFEEMAEREEEVILQEEKLTKYYESALEQSYFRAEVIKEILNFCDETSLRCKETKELCKNIKLLVENSYVEL